MSIKTKRHPFVLTEALVASTLAILVVVACLSIFVLLWNSSTRQQAQLTADTMHWRKVTALRWTLSRIRRVPNEDPFFVEGTGQEARLVFVFDHGLHVNPKLANYDLGQLYIDKEQGLVLVTKSHPKRGAIGQEEEVATVIWPNAREIFWRFAVNPTTVSENVGMTESLDQGWTSTWKNEWTKLPAVIEATIVDDSPEPEVVTAIVARDIGPLTLK